MPPPAMPGWSVVVHGGAGKISRSRDTATDMDGMRAALDCAVDVLEGRAPRRPLRPDGMRSQALAAAIQAVMELEDRPTFNAGKGSVLSDGGWVEMEAAVVEGWNRDSGAACGLRSVRHAVELAEIVRVTTPHTLIGFDDAEELAKGKGLEVRAPEWFVVEARVEQQRRAAERGLVVVDRDEAAGREGMGTVGAVVRDGEGRVAAAVSTGGRSNKMAGRVGDSACVGAGVYAGPLAAVCGTGVGEAFVRHSACAQVGFAMQYGKLSLQEAVRKVVYEEMDEGDGGIIAVGADGSMSVEFNSLGMFWGKQHSEGGREFGIWK
ncbi:unnamed protein product [Ostreobium quekettii]|uniref:beta-aspartyl-peptidase n=1 Tax=Ostreobium quekettii TaxID=121088 RepID=A0A8S1IV69_9CHLO|nr:unnamed protein product [Ostreobium quekettii]